MLDFALRCGRRGSVTDATQGRRYGSAMSVRVRPGERIPADGTVVSGHSGVASR
jgi:hypothetical protein